MIWKECIFSLERKPLTNDGRGFVFIWRLARYSTCIYILYLNSRYSLKIKAYFMPTLHLAIMLKYLVLQNISCWSDIFMPISCLIRSYLHFNRDKCRGENIWGWHEWCDNTIQLLVVHLVMLSGEKKKIHFSQDFKFYNTEFELRPSYILLI